MERFVRAVAPCALRRTVFYPCYGLAEATLMVSGSSRQHVPVVRSFDKKSLLDHKIHPVSGNSPEQSPEQSMVGCGSSLPDQEIAIVGPGSHTPAAANEIGEIWVKGASVAKGYWGRPEETRETFQAFMAGSGNGPFLRTGDLGFMDNGELFITGRLKDLLIIRGQNHYPQDIELTTEQSDSVLRPGG